MRQFTTQAAWVKSKRQLTLGIHPQTFTLIPALDAAQKLGFLRNRLSALFAAAAEGQHLVLLLTCQ
jgi:hypothetical protein